LPVRTIAIVIFIMASNDTEVFRSHCWEDDGSFHVVCIFVITISIACGLITLLCTYRILSLLVQSFREDTDVHENVKMYTLQPKPNRTKFGEEEEEERHQGLNHIATVESIIVDKDQELKGSQCLC